MLATSYQIADSIDIKTFKSVFKSELLYSDADELFYDTGHGTFVYVFKYGVVCFLDYESIQLSEFLRFITPYCRNLFEQQLNEEFRIETGAPEYKFGYNKLEIVKADKEILRLIMLNVSQSVALDYYYEQTNKLLEEANYHTQFLEKKGRLDISGRELKKYIGKTLPVISEKLHLSFND